MGNRSAAVRVILTAWSLAGAGLAAPGRTAEGFPLPDRPVAGIVSPVWSSGPDRDLADEAGQLIRAMGVRPGMTVADIGAGSGYHTFTLAAAVGPAGRVYAEDIIDSYLAGLRSEVAARGLANVVVVRGTPDDPKLPPAAVDRAVLVHMYHEIGNPYALLWRLAGSLKPGARVGVIDMDRRTQDHGTRPALLKCEFAAVGYRQLSIAPIRNGGGYLATFAAPAPASPSPDKTA